VGANLRSQQERSQKSGLYLHRNGTRYPDRQAQLENRPTKAKRAGAKKTRRSLALIPGGRLALVQRNEGEGGTSENRKIGYVAQPALVSAVGIERDFLAGRGSLFE
jgi:hypothetical protein